MEHKEAPVCCEEGSPGRVTAVTGTREVGAEVQCKSGLKVKIGSA